MIKNAFGSSSELTETLSETLTKLLFECLSQIVALSLGEIHARDRDFAAGERSVIGQGFGNFARDVLAEEVGSDRADLFRQRSFQSDHLQRINDGWRYVLENVVQNCYQRSVGLSKRRTVTETKLAVNCQITVIN